MKTLGIILVVLGMSGLANANCPNLAGKFQCKDFNNGAVQDVTITQAAQAGGVAYKIAIVANGKTETRDYIADSQVRSTPHPDYTARTEKSFCSNNNLLVEIKGTTKNGENLNAVVTVKIDSKNNLWNSYVGTLGKQALNFEETCLRK